LGRDWRQVKRNVEIIQRNLASTAAVRESGMGLGWRVIKERVAEASPLLRRSPLMGTQVMASGANNRTVGTVAAGLTNIWSWMMRDTPASVDSGAPGIALRWANLTPEAKQAAITAGITPEKLLFMAPWASIPGGVVEVDGKIWEQALEGNRNAQMQMAVFQYLFPQSELKPRKGPAGKTFETLGRILDWAALPATLPATYLTNKVWYSLDQRDVTGPEGRRGPDYNRMPSLGETFNRLVHPERVGLEAGEGIGVAVGAAVGLRPSDAMYVPVSRGGGMIVSLVTGPDVVIANAARGIHLGRTGFSAYRQLKNLQASAVLVNDLKAARNYAAQAKNILRTTSRSRVTRAMYRLTAGTPEEIVAGTRGTRISEKIAKAIRQGATPSELMRKFTGLSHSPDTAKALAKAGTSVDNVKEILSSHSVLGASRKVINAAEEELDVVVRTIQDLKSPSTGVQRAFEAGNVTVEAERAHDVINQLLARKKFLEAKLLSKPRAQFMGLDRLPKTSLSYRVMRETANTPFERALSSLWNGHMKMPSFFTKADNQPVLNALQEQRNRLSFRVKSLEHRLSTMPWEGEGTLARGPHRGVLDEIKRVTAELEAVETKLDNLSTMDGKRKLINWRPTAISPAKLKQEIYKRVVYVHTSPSANVPPHALQHNLEQFESFMKLAGVRAPVRNRVLDEFINAKNDSDFFEGIRSLGKAVDDSPLVAPARRGRVSEEIQAGMSQAEKESISEFFDTIESLRNYGILPTVQKVPGGGLMKVDTPLLPVMDGKGITKGVPAGPEEMIGHMTLPSIDSLVEATSYYRRVMRTLYAKGGKPGQAVAWAMRGQRHVRESFTQFWKNWVLLARPIAAPLRIQLEQNIRAMAYGKASAFHGFNDWFRYVRRKEDLPRWFNGDFVGTINRDLKERWVRGEGKQKFVPEDGYIFYEKWAEEIAHRQANPLFRKLAVTQDPDASLRWLMSSEGAHLRQVMERNVERHLDWLKANGNPGAVMDDAWRSYTDRMWQHLTNLTAGHPGLMEGIATGNYVKGAARGSHPQMVQELDRLRTLDDQLVDEYWDALRSDPDDALRIDAHQREVRAQMDEISRDLQGVGDTGMPLDHANFPDELQRLADEQVITPPMTVDGRVPQLVDPKQGKWNVTNKMFDFFFQKPDLKFSRMPFLRQEFDRVMAELTGAGWTKAAAEQQAWARSAKLTAEVFYDLGTRTSFQRFIKNFMPFFPAWQETLGTYLVKIPRQYGFQLPFLGVGVGHAYLATRLQTFDRALRVWGIKPEDAAPIPGVSQVLNTVFGSPQSEIVSTFYPQSLNMVTGMGFLPGLGPLPGAVLSKLSEETNIAWIDALSEKLQPFGSNWGPYTVNKLWEAATGTASPLDFLSADTQERKHQDSIESATNLAYMEYKRKGLIPQMSEYAKDPKNPTQQEINSWRSATEQVLLDIEATGKKWARGFALTEGIGSMIWPAAVHVTDKAAMEYRNLYHRLLEMAAVKDKFNLTPQEENRVDQLRQSPQGQKLYDDFIRKWPNADLYLTPRSMRSLTEAQKGQARDKRGIDGTFDEMRTRLSTQQRLWLGMYLSSYRQYQSRVEQVNGQWGNDASKILKDWRGYQDQLGPHQDRWEVYKAFNSEGDRLFDRLVESSKNAKHRPNYTLEQQKLLELQRLMKQTLPYLEEGGVRPEEFRRFRALVSQRLDQLNTQFGAARTPLQKNLEWWFESVYRSYWDKAGAIFDKINNTPEDRRGPLFDQLRQLANAQKSVRGPGGRLYPTPEQFQWGSMSPQERTASQVKWLGRPIEWLTQHQRGKVISGSGTPKATQFFELVAGIKGQVKRLVERYGLSTSSNAYRDLIARQDAIIAQEAKRAGVGHLWDIAQQPLYRRLVTTGIINSPSFRHIADSVDTIWDWLSTRGGAMGEGVNPGGDSADAKKIRAQIFPQIQAMVRHDPELRKLFDSLGQALAPRGQSRLVKEDLYHRVFFDPFAKRPVVSGGGGGAPRSKSWAAAIEAINNGIQLNYNNNPIARSLRDYGQNRWGITVGAQRNDPGSQHDYGNALDFMVGQGNYALGDEVRNHLMQNQKKYGFTVLIWNRNVWTPSRGWHPYYGRSPHTDHVHVDWTPR
jgi:hypothetical protein